MVLLDLLGRRWVLRIVWELRDEPRRFRDLQDSIGASPTIINTRLAELREARLVELDEAAGYRLTPLGQELLRLFLPLHLWSEKWAKAVARVVGRGQVLDDLRDVLLVDRRAVDLDHLRDLGLPEVLLEFRALRLGQHIVGRMAGPQLPCTTSRLGPGLKAAFSSGRL